MQPIVYTTTTDGSARLTVMADQLLALEVIASRKPREPKSISSPARGRHAPFKPDRHATRERERENYQWLAGCGAERPHPLDAHPSRHAR